MELHNEAYEFRDLLMKHISENPGVRYRELLRLTGVVNGVLTYHLSALEKSDRVRVDRKIRITRYYPLNVSTDELDIIGCIKPETARKIILFMLENDLCTFGEIVDHTGRVPSTVSWNLKRLRDAGIILERHGEYTLYRIANRKTMIEILSKYKKSFMDEIVNNYIEMIDEL
jgi:predicted transcriptional regulator